MERRRHEVADRLRRGNVGRLLHLELGELGEHLLAVRLRERDEEIRRHTGAQQERGGVAHAEPPARQVGQVERVDAAIVLDVLGRTADVLGGDDDGVRRHEPPQVLPRVGHLGLLEPRPAPECARIAGDRCGREHEPEDRGDEPRRAPPGPAGRDEEADTRSAGDEPGDRPHEGADM